MLFVLVPGERVALDAEIDEQLSLFAGQIVEELDHLVRPVAALGDEGEHIALSAEILEYGRVARIVFQDQGNVADAVLVAVDERVVVVLRRRHADEHVAEGDVAGHAVRVRGEIRLVDVAVHGKGVEKGNDLLISLVCELVVVRSVFLFKWNGKILAEPGHGEIPRRVEGIQLYADRIAVFIGDIFHAGEKALLRGHVFARLFAHFLVPVPAHENCTVRHQLVVSDVVIGIGEIWDAVERAVLFEPVVNVFLLYAVAVGHGGRETVHQRIQRPNVILVGQLVCVDGGSLNGQNVRQLFRAQHGGEFGAEVIARHGKLDFAACFLVDRAGYEIRSVRRPDHPGRVDKPSEIVVGPVKFPAGRVFVRNGLEVVEKFVRSLRGFAARGRGNRQDKNQ